MATAIEDLSCSIYRAAIISQEDVFYNERLSVSQFHGSYFYIENKATGESFKISVEKEK